MDMYTENNGGFQPVEGTVPFEENQVQGTEGYAGGLYQDTVTDPAYYADSEGAESLPAEQYQETVMGNAYCGSTDGAGNFPAEPYQGTVAENAYYDDVNGQESLPAGTYQETAAGYGQETYMEEADALPVAPGQILEMENPEQYQTLVPKTEENALVQSEFSGTEDAMMQSEFPETDHAMVQTELSETEDGIAQTELSEVQDGTAQAELSETEDDPEQEGVSGMDGSEQEPESELETAEAETTAAREDDEETKRLKHEEAEARRKAEWEEKQRAKKAAEQEKLDQLAAMSDDAAMSAAMKRVGADTEKLTRRNMKDCVAEYIQTLCLEDPGLARMVMHPDKSMINCFHYINRKAKEFIQQEMEDNDVKPENGVYGSDVPDDLCYQWAVDYFRDPDAEEDRKEEEKFVPRPYAGKSGSKAKSKKTAEKKAAAKKPAGKKAETPKQETDGQMSFIGQMSLGDFTAQEVKAE
mgnify:CR=1 FL=1